MLNDLAMNQQTYLVTGYTDLRCSIDGLAAIVQAQLKLDPYSSALFCSAEEDVTVSRDCSGRETVFCSSTNGLTTENSGGRAMKQKHCCSLHSRGDGFWKA